MRAIAIDRPGGPDVLTLRDVPAPNPGPGEVLVAVEAAGINYIDVYYRDGTYPSATHPYVPGSEAAGTVERVGSGVTEFAPGDRVATARAASGAYAQYSLVAADQLVHVPQGIELATAAAVMLQGMTAHYLCNSTFSVHAHDTVLVHAGAGGVGLLLTQLVKAKGATVFATVSTPEKAERSRLAGADHTILYTTEHFDEAIERIVGPHGIDVVYDSVGKTTWERSIATLKPRGLFVLYGGSSGPVPPFDMQVLNKGGSLFATRPTLTDYVATPTELAWRAGELFRAIEDGSLDVRIGHTYPLEDAARAHRELEARQTTGKLLLIP